MCVSVATDRSDTPVTKCVRLCALGIATLSGSACADTPRSCDLETASLVLRATISDTDDGVEAEIELSTPTMVDPDFGAGAGTALALCSDSDRLLVNGEEATEVHALGHLYYVVEFDGPTSNYEVTLDRRDRDDVTIVVTAPPSFEIDAPSEQSEHSRSAPLQVSWSPAWPDHESELTVADEIGAGCIDGLGERVFVDDTGDYVLGASALTSESGGRCEVKASLTRIAEADYPASLAEGGSVTAVVKRRRAFTSVE